jgi:hypothetical protein
LLRVQRLLMMAMPQDMTCDAQEAPMAPYCHDKCPLMASCVTKCLRCAALSRNLKAALNGMSKPERAP